MYVPKGTYDHNDDNADDQYEPRERRSTRGGRFQRGGKTLRLSHRGVNIKDRERRGPKPAQESATKRGVMPVANPTGNPFPNHIHLPEDSSIIKRMSIRVNTNKIAEAPRSYSQKLIEAQ